ncbi:MAG: GNAT family N-acetyltransferase [Bacillota bacterium]
MDNFSIESVDLSKLETKSLVEESLAEGHRHLFRLIDEYKSGKNKFSEKGEGLFAAFYNERVIGICGLNIDPYLNDMTICRVRRLYVLKEFRRHGIGRRLIGVVINEAKKHFKVIVLNTDNPVADLFYRSLRFSNKPLYPNATHHLMLIDEFE